MIRMSACISKSSRSARSGAKFKSSTTPHLSAFRYSNDRAGKVPGFKLPKDHRVHRSELENYIATNFATTA